MKLFIPLVVSVAFLFLMLQPNPGSIAQEESVSQGEEKLEFVGVGKCKLCHNRRTTGKFIDNWEETKHAKAFELLKGEERQNPDCVKCHTTGYGHPGGFVSLEETEDMVGVQCEMCHGPAEKHVKSRPNDVVPVAWKVSEERCVYCHNDENPNWDPEKYTLEDGTKVGFAFEQAVKKVNHSEILEDEE